MSCWMNGDYWVEHTKNGEHVLVFVANAEYSKFIDQELDDDVIVDELIDVLEDVFDITIKNSDIKGSHVTRWGADPYAGGSISGISTKTNLKNDFEALKRIKKQPVFFAGEHLSRYKYGTLNGAEESGIDAAKDAIATAL